jgi:hypothetical protein
MFAVTDKAGKRSPLHGMNKLLFNATNEPDDNSLKTHKIFMLNL